LIGQKLTSGRRAVDETCRERKHGASLLPLSGRRQPFFDAVAGEPGAAARGRREDAPVAASRSTTPSLPNVVPPSVDVARPHRRRSRFDDRADPGVERKPFCSCRCCCMLLPSMLHYITLETIQSGLSKRNFKDHYGEAVKNNVRI